MSVSKEIKLDEIRTNLAEEIAISEPELIAIPTSVIVKAGESLILSPTIATVAL
jgi:hypothetical protein